MDEAIQLYLQAYSTVDQDPSLLYNVAFIYEQTGRVKKASDMYRQVARATRSSPELRVKAYERRDQLPAPRVSVPLLEGAPPRAAPVKRAPIRRAPATTAPRPAPARVVSTPKAAPKAPPKAPPSAGAATAASKDGAAGRRLSPEQRRRLEMRKRRARAKKGL